MSETPVRGILFTHGQMARGMIDAVRCISGLDPDVLLPLSNDGRGGEELQGELDRLSAGCPTIVFTDLLSGSCATAARISSRERPDRAVICGVNLPMLLDFVFHRDMPLAELVERLAGKGREGVRVIQPPA